MIEPKLEVPAELRDLAEKTIDQAEKAFGMTVAVSDLTGGPTPGSVVNPNALYALPVFSLFPYVLSGVALGNAQACLNDYIEFARHRASTYNRAKLSDMRRLKRSKGCPTAARSPICSLHSGNVTPCNAASARREC